jgi:hypothetical protein
MTNPIIEILDVITGEQTRREMTDKEYADELKRQASNEAIKITNENKRQAAIDKLAALGLTPDDLNALAT